MQTLGKEDSQKVRLCMHIPCSIDDNHGDFETPVLLLIPLLWSLYISTGFILQRSFGPLENLSRASKNFLKDKKHVNLRIKFMSVSSANIISNS